jgi:hypothetical protein
MKAMGWVKVDIASTFSFLLFCIDLNFTSNIGFRKLGNSTEKGCLDEETGWLMEQQG